MNIGKSTETENTCEIRPIQVDESTQTDSFSTVRLLKVNTFTQTEDTHDIEIMKINEEEREILEHQLSFDREKDISFNQLTGRRIIDIRDYTRSCVNLQNDHRQICTLGYMEFLRENRCGMRSVVHFKCRFCSREESIETLQKQSSDTGNTINSEVVWAALTSGSGYSQTADIFSALDIPFMFSSTFYKLEEKLHDVWESQLAIDIERGNEEERILAIQNNQVCFYSDT